LNIEKSKPRKDSSLNGKEDEENKILLRNITEDLIGEDENAVKAELR
jgi:hypothetical protein